MSFHHYLTGIGLFGFALAAPAQGVVSSFTPKPSATGNALVEAYELNDSFWFGLEPDRTRQV